MIRISVSELFPLTATLIDESNGTISTGKTVLYEIRQQPGGTQLVPPLSGVLIESTITPGMYTDTLSINTTGTYLAHITCSEFVPYSEEIIVLLSPVGVDTPVVAGNKFGSVKMTINRNSIKMSTKAITPIMNTYSRI